MEAFIGATLDSRQVKPGMLFVAIKGEKVDGRDFIPAALAAGAVGVIDGREELARKALEYRRSLKAVVIGITGSAGKTTTKEFTAKLLECVRIDDGHGGKRPAKVHATSGNFNNDLGLPLTILNCPKDADFLVLEMGTNHPGEIDVLCKIAEPEVGIIASIGTAHIEFFKTQEGIAREKGTLFSSLTTKLNHKSFAVALANCCKLEILRELSAADLIEVSTPAPFACPLPGTHNIDNLSLAWECARRFGATAQDAVKALADFALPGARWHRSCINEVFFTDDSYNANPTSMIAALETFLSESEKAISPNGRSIAVLGDMFELGETSADWHQRVLSKAMELPYDSVLVVGASFAEAAKYFSDVIVAEDAGMATKVLTELTHAGDRVLIKASHSMHLDTILSVFGK